MSKKKQKKETNKQEVKQKEPVKQDLVGIEVYFAINKIPNHHKAGMMNYKGAKNLKKTIVEWKKFFEKY